LTFPASEVENRHPMEIELPQRVVELIDKHHAGTIQSAARREKFPETAGQDQPASVWPNHYDSIN